MPTSMDIPTSAADIPGGRADARSVFITRSNRGEGFDPGEAGDNLVLVRTARSDDDVSVFRDGDAAVLIGNVHGSWAVRVGA